MFYHLPGKSTNGSAIAATLGAAFSTALAATSSRGMLAVGTDAVRGERSIDDPNQLSYRYMMPKIKNIVAPPRVTAENKKEEGEKFRMTKPTWM